MVVSRDKGAGRVGVPGREEFSVVRSGCCGFDLH